MSTADTINGVPKASIEVAMKKLADGSEKIKDSSFRVIFKAFHENVKWFFILKKGCNEEVADDLASEVMSKIWQGARLYKFSKAQVSTWVYAIAKNVYIDYIRREQTKVQFYAIYELFHTFDYTANQYQEFDVHSLDPNPEQIYMEVEKGEQIKELFTEEVLGGGILIVMKMRYEEQLSLKEIAQKLNQNESTVRVKLMRGRNMMKEFAKSNYEMTQQFSL